MIECKHWEENIDLHDNQLLRYFNVSKAKFGLLTNGIIYRFYTDLDKQNVMDKKPFLEFDITAMKDYQVEELKKFHKSYFDVESILNTASELKYTRELKKLINQEMNDPNPEFVKYFAKQVYPGVVTAKVLEQFTGLTKKSAQILISDLITERLNIAINKESEANEAQETMQESKDGHVKIITTGEELEGYMIVKTILRQKIDAKRVVYRDSQTYFAILLDDNNRKTICRLYFNGKKKYFVILDENRKEIKTQI